MARTAWKSRTANDKSRLSKVRYYLISGDGMGDRKNIPNTSTQKIMHRRKYEGRS